MSMSAVHRLGAAAVIGAGLTAVLVPLVPGQAAAAPRKLKVTIRKIGKPAWRPVDFHMMKANLGIGYADFINFAATLLPAPAHAPHPELGIGPGTAHSGWESELGTAIRTAGITEQTTFTTSDFDQPNYWFFCYMVVPDKGAPTGATPDGASTPMIEKRLFPMASRGVVYRDGGIFDSAFAFDVKALDAIEPPFATGNHSHFPMFAATDSSANGPGSDGPGTFTYHQVVLDQLGNGWEIDTKFRVVQ